MLRRFLLFLVVDYYINLDEVSTYFRTLHNDIQRNIFQILPWVQCSPNLFSPWLKCPRTSPATRTWDSARQCWSGVPTDLIHRSINDSASFTATHLYSSNNLRPVEKLRKDLGPHTHNPILVTRAILQHTCKMSHVSRDGNFCHAITLARDKGLLHECWVCNKL